MHEKEGEHDGSSRELLNSFAIPYCVLHRIPALFSLRVRASGEKISFPSRELRLARSLLTIWGVSDLFKLSVETNARDYDLTIC
jgi:hypothetical protein